MILWALAENIWSPPRESVTPRERGLGFAARSGIFPTSLLTHPSGCTWPWLEVSSPSPSRLTLEAQPDLRSLDRHTGCRAEGQSRRLPAPHESDVSWNPLEVGSDSPSTPAPLEEQTDFLLFHRSAPCSDLGLWVGYIGFHCWTQLQNPAALWLMLCPTSSTEHSDPSKWRLSYLITGSLEQRLEVLECQLR